MLDVQTRQRIDTARDILVGKVPDPKSQVEQITLALMYKFMGDMDAQSEEYGGKVTFFAGEFARYSWRKIVGRGIGAYDALNLYSEGMIRMGENPGMPALFRSMFNNAYLPFRDPETLKVFLQVIDEFEYDNSERLGDAFEYLLSIMGSQGDAGQFRTPRHIIDFIVEIVDPKKGDTILDPACGTAGFLVSAYKHIVGGRGIGMDGQDRGDELSGEERARLARNVRGYDISPDMVRLSLVNLYLHGFPDPDIFEYDTLTSEERWGEYANVILANPPFMSPKGGIRPHNRFSVTSKRSEVLFVDYIAEHLTPDGRAGVIVPEGIIFQSQNAHTQLRKMLVEEYLVAVVSLPPGVFNPYSGVKTSILLLDKALARRSVTIGFFKVENDGFDLGAQRRPVDGNDLPRVKAELAEYLRRVREGDGVEEFAPEHGLVVAKERIGADGEFNLSGERYRTIDRSSGSRWPVKSVGELTSQILSGGTPSTKVKAFWEGEIPWITSADIVDLKTILPRRHITDEAIEQSATNLIPEDNIVVVTRVGLGKLFKTPFDVCISQDSQGLILKDGIDPDYLVQVLRSAVEHFVEVGQGTTIRGVTKRQLREVTVPVPPLDVQHEIVSEIEGYQKVIDGARAVVENWRPRIAVDPEWTVVELGEVCELVQYGLSSRLNTERQGYKTFRMAELVDGRCLDSGDMKYADVSDGNFEKYRLNRGDILFNRTNSFEHVGRTGIFALDGEYCFASYLIRLSISREIAKPRYVNAFMNTDAFQTGVKRLATRAIGQSNINAKSLMGYRIPLPPLTIQQSIVDEIEDERKLVDANRRFIERMEGKVREVVGRAWADTETDDVQRG